MIKGRIFAVKRCEIHDGDGLRTTVFLKGCPLRCKWCHNPESLSMVKQIACYTDKCLSCARCVSVCESGVHSFTGGVKTTDYSSCVSCGECVKFCPADALKLWGKYVTASEVVSLVSSDKIFFDKTGGGVTLSGGEPLAQPEFCLEVLKALKAEGINTALDTSLCASSHSLCAVIPYVDTFLVDVKAYSSTLHKELTGKENDLILENIDILKNAKARIEFRVPLIEGANDCEMEQIARLVSSVPHVGVKILPYHDYAVDKYHALGYSAYTGATVPSAQKLEEIRSLFTRYGAKVITE